jgi:DNA-3-methyladenine glycosylase II
VGSNPTPSALVLGLVQISLLIAKSRVLDFVKTKSAKTVVHASGPWVRIPPSSPSFMPSKINFKKAITHLRLADPVLGKLFDCCSTVVLRPHTNYFQSLVEAIVSQQLSDKAAITIINRFKALFPCIDFPSPKQVLRKKDSALRSAGLSGAKVSYIKNIAQAIENKTVHFTDAAKLTDEEIIEMLVKVKGVGRWTAEIFLIFSLGRRDVFSFGDLGLRNAVKKLYSLRQDPSLKQLHKLSSRWRPYCTCASLYLWASLNNRQKA